MFDIADVSVELFHIFSSAVAAYGAATFGYLQCEGFSFHCLVASFLCVVICKLYGRNLVFALMARHHEIVIDHAAFHSFGTEFGLVGNLGVIAVKIFGQVDYRLFNQLQIAHTADGDAKFHGVVCLYLLLV